ncbi:hypothetical protein EYV94_07130 [Puteibacter caeruleilacunae]|nr:hypothetical protein EYV94_07130 [Puteibacter caeruleilacunae]
MDYQLNPEFNHLKDFVENVESHFANGGECIFKVRNEVRVFQEEGTAINVKAFRVPHFINRIVYSFFRDGKAKRSFIYASRLIEKGASTPAPIAWVNCKKGGLLGKSYYLSVHLNYDFTLRDVLDDKTDDKQKILEDFAVFTYKELHCNGFFHLDYSPGNVLITRTESGYKYDVIDLNRMEFGPIDYEKGLTNFRQMNYDSGITEFFARTYARLNGRSEDEAVERLKFLNDEFIRKRNRRQRIKHYLLFRFLKK